MDYNSDLFVPLSTQARATLTQLNNGGLRVSPFCHHYDDRELRGWTLDLPADASACTLPMPYNLFHGVSVARCELSEREVLAHLQQADALRAKLRRALASRSPSHDKAASWRRCRPTRAALQCVQRVSRTQFEVHPAGPSIQDSEVWTSELSPDSFVGVYFRWSELYVVCQSFLPGACQEVADMVHGVGGGATVRDICLSEEIQWLRQACARNRARLIAEVCEAIGLRVPTMQDPFAARPVSMAMVVFETLHHDLALMMPASTTVRLFNYCGGLRRNGQTVCVMPPDEGVWVFGGGGGVATTTTSASIPEGMSLMPTSTLCVAAGLPPMNEGRSSLSFQMVVAAGAARQPSSSARSSSVVEGLMRFVEKEQEPDEAQRAFRAAFARHMTFIAHCVAMDPEGGGGGGGFWAENELNEEDVQDNNNNGNGDGRAQKKKKLHYLRFNEFVLQRMVAHGWTRDDGAILRLAPLCVWRTT